MRRPSGGPPPAARRRLVLPLAILAAAATAARGLVAGPAELAGGATAAGDVLRGLLAGGDGSAVALDGMVTRRRAIGKHLVFLDVAPRRPPRIGDGVVGGRADDYEAPVQAILRRDVWHGNETTSGGNTNSTFDAYHKILQPGCHARLVGTAGPSRDSDEAILFATSAGTAITLCNGNPQHVRAVLGLVADGSLRLEEAAAALPVLDGADELAALLDGVGKTNATHGELAKGILARFPGGFLTDPSRLTGPTAERKAGMLPPPPDKFGTVPKEVGDANRKRKREDETAKGADGGEAMSVGDALELVRGLSSEASLPATVVGWVRNRRRYGGSVAVIEMVDDFAAASNSTSSGVSDVAGMWGNRVYAVLHPGALDGSDMYGEILGPGARAAVRGRLLADGGRAGGVPAEGSGEVRLWATDVRAVRSSWRPGTVKRALDLLHGGRLGADEAAACLPFPGGYSQAEDVASGSTTDAERDWLASELAASLQGENSRVGRVSDSALRTLRDHAPLMSRRPLVPVDLGGFTSSQSERADSVLSSRGGQPRTTSDGSSRSSRWERAKRPQLRWMIEQIAGVVESHPDRGRRRLRVVDVGGGRGLLSNLLAESFGEDDVEVLVVDISRSATRNGAMRARRRGIGNVRYEAGDASSLDVGGDAPADVVVALHACGVLSDVALGHACAAGAAFVVCPCCFRSNPHLRVPLPGGVEGGGGGGDSGAPAAARGVSPEEWLGVDPGAYGDLTGLAEVQGDSGLQREAMHAVCALRAEAVEREWRCRSRHPGARVETSIRTFPVGLSTRNLCLVGRFGG